MVFTILYQNVRGLRTKVNELYSSLLNVDADFVCITESWLNDNILSTEFLNENLICHRRDRNYAQLGSTKGGGSLIIHKKSIHCTRIQSFEANIDFIDDIWLAIDSPQGKIFLCCVYITSKSNNDYLYGPFMDKIMDNLSRINSSDRVVIVGDFNIPELNWDKDMNGITASLNAFGTKEMDLLNLLSYGKMNQCNLIRNHELKILDLILATDNCGGVEVTKSHTTLVPIDQYHPPLEIRVIETVKYLDELDHRKFNFRKANYELINEKINSVDWSFMNDSPVDVCVIN